MVAVGAESSQTEAGGENRAGVWGRGRCLRCLRAVMRGGLTSSRQVLSSVSRLAVSLSGGSRI